MRNPLSMLERQFERFIERPLMRLFGGRLEPSDIAKYLSRAMEDERQVFSGKLVGPNIYEVRISAEDAAEFKSYEESLLKDFAEYLLDLAERRGIHLLGRPQITLVPVDGLKRGDIDVTARLVDPTAEGHTQQFTHPFTVVDDPEIKHLSATAWLELPDRTVALNQPFVTLGRSIDNDVILEGDDVSRHHAQLKLRGGHYVVTDLESANGTRVNGKRISECVLQDRDELCLAAICMTYKVADSWLGTKR